MGRGKAEQPTRIAEKLRQIRLDLGFTQDEMAKALEAHGVKIYRGYVGSFEIGARVPSLLVTLAYARIAGVSVETLIDDKLDLPK
ncbi:MAG: helix-turn-helix transcriptional regulator [Pyrinomonadaceae bacterium]